MGEKQTVKKQLGKYCCAILAAVLLSFGCALLSLHALPKVYRLEEPTDAISILDQVEIEAVNSEIAPDGTVTMTGDDPNLILRGVDVSAGTVCISFAEPMKEGSFAQLYYSRDGKTFNEVDSVSVVIHNDQDEIFFTLDSGEYQTLRVDINCDYQLRDIRISQQPPVVVSQPEAAHINWTQWLVSLVIFLGEALLIAWKWDKIRTCFVNKYRQYCQQKKQFWRSVAIFFGFVLLALVVWGGLCLAGLLSPTKYTGLYFLLGGCTLGGLFALWNQHADHPERMFLILTLCVGLVYAVLLPKATIVSLDDETHYERALQMSYCGTTYYTDADYLLIYQKLSNQISIQADHSNTQQLNAAYEQGATQIETGVGGLTTSLAYLPSGGAMWLARVLGGSFTQIFIAGRIGNLICYSLVFYFALKRLKRGNMMVAVFALFPLMIFSASNYSYDGCCLSFLALGTAFFLEEYQHRDRPISWQNAVGMLLCLTIGCLPKAIYFPVFLMCLFMPREKFASRRQHRRYLLAVVAVTALVAFTFVAPFLFSQGNADRFNDTRGGVDVNAGEQISFILSNPLNYAVLLLRFLFLGYFRPSFLIPYAVSYQAYMPAISSGNIFVALLLFLFLFERTDEVGMSEQNRPSPVLRLAAIVSFFCAVCLAATAMYVAFTPVGSTGINGCQARYMMPVLLPMLMVVRLNQRWNPIPRKYLNFGILFLVGALLFWGQLPLVTGYAHVL